MPSTIGIFVIPNPFTMLTIRTPFVLALGLSLIGAAQPAFGQACTSTDVLATPYDSNNGLDGIMFDLTALSDITINCFEVNMALGNYDAVILHKTGTHVGFEQSAGAWTELGTAPAIPSNGEGVPTAIPIDVNVGMVAGTTHAFYISTTDGSSTKYTDGNLLSAVFASDANLQVKQGTGINYPFAFNLSPRKFNGTIHYSAGAVGIADQLATPLLSPWPNPATKTLHIAGSIGWTVTVTNALGQVLSRSPWSAELDVSNLASGLYLLNLSDKDGNRLGSVQFVKE